MASVVVVGGGVAGLSCAYRLSLAGHDVEVLERESTPGGRMRSEQCAGYILERGAECISQADRNLQGLLVALNLQSSLRRVESGGDAVFRAGRFDCVEWGSPTGLLRSPSLSPVSRARVARMALDLARHRRVLDPLHPERAIALDDEDAESYLATAVGRGARDSLVAPLLSASLFCDVRELSQAAVLLALRQRGAALQTLEGGLGGIAGALAERVRVRTGCEVVSLHTEKDGARLCFRAGGRDRMVVADAAVLALPGPLVPELYPKLTPTERGYFESVRFVRGLVAQLMLAEVPRGMGHYRMAFSRRDGFDLYGATAGHQRPGAAPRGAGLLSAVLTSDAATRMWQAPDREVIDLVCENFARTPIGALAPVGSALHRYPLMLPLFRPGSAGRLASFLSRSDRSPRLAFAGDYLVGPSAEAAVTSGMRAATEIAHLLQVR